MGLTLPPKKYLGAAFTAGAIGGAAVAGLTSPSHFDPTARADLGTSHIDPYDHTSCPATIGNRNDPITVVLVGSSGSTLYEDIHDHLDHHDIPLRTSFFDGLTRKAVAMHGLCELSHISAATQPSFPVLSRLHMRLTQGIGESNDVDIDPLYKQYLLATPHKEQAFIPNIADIQNCDIDPLAAAFGVVFGLHRIVDDGIEDPPGSGNFGSFDQAQETIKADWAPDPGNQHQAISTEDWNNVAAIETTFWDESLNPPRCWRARNADGVVDIISAAHVHDEGFGGLLSGTGGKNL